MRSPMKNTDLYLIRHGEAFANVDHIIGGMRGDTGLTPIGVRQAEHLRDRLAATREIEADVLIASTLPRARQTAGIIAPALGLPLTLDDSVQELRPGEADGLSVEDAVLRFDIPDVERDPFRPVSPGGESWGDFMLRVSAALAHITREHAGKTVVVVTHGGFIDGAFLYFFRMNALALPPAQFATRHTSVTHWQHRLRWNQTEGWHLVAYNDCMHLRDLDRGTRIPWAGLSSRSPSSAEEPAVPIPTEMADEPTQS
jgi:2,3-bisphosphoglycerate-dependent phosphoglycerate mutase